jgi:E3 ubiquitin-protein transferase RMND5
LADKVAEITKLAGSLIYTGKPPPVSDYDDILNAEHVWQTVSDSFTGEFCALLDLSAESPLYVAVTAGSLALPTLLKMQNIMKEKKTEWTSANELPVEVTLPDKYKFHSIFVCPVSKEQTTDQNPPMMIPCGHVLAADSLTKLSRGGNRFKCPYCPLESNPRDAVQIYL